MIFSDRQSALRYPHALAVLLVCATFPLIWVGGLVTTYHAGMAVPDWPTTYGYNLLRYPWQTWILGPWDLFIEHGHRLLGALVGLLTIAFLLAEWIFDARRWMRWMAVAALAAVIGQGILGGMRVRLDEVLLARIHGCVGPAFFALTVALAVLTSRRWFSAEPPEVLAKAAPLKRLALVTTALAYLQLVLGSALRHMPVWASPGDFRTALVFHLIVALALTVHIGWLLVRVFKIAGHQAALVRPALALAALLVVQLGLGFGTWMAKYGWPTGFVPSWLSPSWLAGGGQLDYVVVAEGPLQAYLATAHVATGSLILATSLLVALRSLRLVRGASPATAHVSRSMELAV